MEVPVNVKPLKACDGEKSCILVKAAALAPKAKMKQPNLPYIYLCRCISWLLNTVFAHESGANFNGVLCDRAWAGSVEGLQPKMFSNEWLATKQV